MSSIGFYKISFFFFSLEFSFTSELSKRSNTISSRYDYNMRNDFYPDNLEFLDGKSEFAKDERKMLSSIMEPMDEKEDKQNE